ncbi:hypothetical protein AeNC1_015372, partial [Aphanomyces euteiches]
MLLATMVFRTPPPNYAVNGSDIHCIPLNKATATAHVQNNYLDVGMTLVNFDAVVQNQPITTDCVYFSHVKALSLIQCIFSSDFFFLYLAFAASASPIVLFSAESPSYVFMILRATIDQIDFVLHKSTQRASADLCCDDCKNTPGCQLFVWFQGTCYLKSAKGTQSTVTGATAGFVNTSGPSDPSGPTCGAVEANTDYPGQDLYTARTNDAGGCCTS